MTKTIKEIPYGVSDFEHPEIPFGYIVELKYIKRSDKLADTVLQTSIEEAKEQIEKYKDIEIRKLILVYHRWEMVVAQEIIKNRF